MIQNIHLTRRWPNAVESDLESLGKVVRNESDEPLSREELRHALQTAEIVCPTVTDQFDAELLLGDQVKTRLLANFGVGFNHIDIEAAKHAGISVTNTPGVLTDATAEIALNLLLSSARRTAEGERHVRAGAWVGWRPTHMLSTQVTGKTMGIVGAGRIGIAFARKVHHGLGMKILYTSRSEMPESVALELSATRLDLNDLLSQSDFVSLHCPATPETRHLINAETLGQMQGHAHLINTARGDVVDEEALLDALQNQVIAGAGLDVYEQEPVLVPGLDTLDNVVLLPHMGSGTVETREAMGQCALRNVQAFLAGELLPNKVV
ncbi:MAG: D-glycerate dehydrogenase [Pseudomonadales bacterium]|nr:D-glycerate dehydrogenase [Pseudomonadales bacterium]